MTLTSTNFPINFEAKRDSYGFTVRSQHLQRFREYTNIYKEEEEERLDKWKVFLEQHHDSYLLPSCEENNETFHFEVTEKQSIPDGPDQEVRIVGPASDENTLTLHSVGAGTSTTLGQDISLEDNDASGCKSVSNVQAEGFSEKLSVALQGKPHTEEAWAQIRPALNFIDNMMSFRVKKRKKLDAEQTADAQNDLPTIEEVRTSRGESEEQFCDDEMPDDNETASPERAASSDGVSLQPFFPWKEELESLVRGGVPKELRGEMWQAFVGVRTRRVEKYYQDLLSLESDGADSQNNGKLSERCNSNGVGVSDKWRKQIEKDLPRTFPGHPALNDNGRNSLRRVLIAYARHNPSVGYCQAMNFFAGLLLLMMPEENAFWTLIGLIDDYFDGYFTQEMTESQVDQLVFEELMHERFPKLVNHLDYLGVQVAWISGPWFLSIFVNMLPWESVLRVWDVLLFEGTRVMLFRTALALMELYGPAVVTTKDAGDAITLMQSLAGSTFDSSQLVLTACMGFLNVTEERLQELRKKHRPAVLEAIEERSKGRVWNDSKGLATKLYSFKKDSGPLISGTMPEMREMPDSEQQNCTTLHLKPHSTKIDEFLDAVRIDSEVDSVPDLQEQVVWLKAELCRLLEEKRTATLRAEELETALMEMVKQDNRRQLSARVEQLEQEVTELKQALNEKKEQETAMLQVLMRVEQEQRLTEDARIAAEQDVAAQKYAVHVLQEKYDKAVVSFAQMEKRVVMAESMLEATLQYESGQNKAVSSPRGGRADSSPDLPTRRMGLLSFGLGWRDRNKGKPTNPSPSSESKTKQDVSEIEHNDHQEPGNKEP